MSTDALFGKAKLAVSGLAILAVMGARGGTAFFGRREVVSDKNAALWKFP